MRRCSIRRSPTSTMSRTGGHGGAITAALFLRRFVNAKSWAAFRYLRLDAGGKARAAGRRRVPDGARALRDALQSAMPDPWSHSIRASIRSGPRSPPSHLRGPGRGAAIRRRHAHQVIEPIAALRRAPSHDARLDTEALLGERVMIYETTDEGWAWGQLETDGYVGWLSANALAAAARRRPTRSRCRAHSRFRVRTSSCRPPRRCPWARGSPSRGRTSISPSRRRGWHIREVYLAPIKARQPDFVPVAERFSARPISGAARLARTGLLGPRADFTPGGRRRLSARQRHAGTGARQDVVAREPAARRSRVLEGPRRDRARPEMLIHANAHHMMVGIEPAAEAIARIKAAGTEVTSIRV